MKKILVFLLIFSIMILTVVYAIDLETASPIPTGDWDFSGGGIAVESGTTPPACSGSQLFLDTDATSGQRLLACESGTFVLQGDGAGGGTGSVTTLKEETVQVGDADIVTLDFGAGFDLTESPDTEINLTLDFTEVAGHDLFTDFVAAEHVDWAGAGAGTIHTDNYIENATHTGDVTGSGALTIGNDKVLEAHLKAVDSASDEECLTYESTTGDFEWQSCGAGGGEANTASSAGSGTSIYYQKTGVDLEFNAIKSESDDITISLDGATHDIELTFNPGNVASTELSDTADILYETELDTFSELQSQIADETLLKAGTLTDTKLCIYNSASTDIICNSDDANTQLSQEQVEDFAGALITDGTGTHTRVTITYQDGTDDIDFVVDDMNDDQPDDDSEVPDAITVAGGTINTSTITLDTGANPIVDGQIRWDSTTERIEVGDDGAATLDFYSGAHTTDTQADEVCAGTTTYLDGEGNCDDISSVYEAADADIAKINEAETITGDWDIGGGTLQVPNSTSLPGSCEVGDAYMDTDATSGQRWYLCESANTWAVQGGGGSGGNVNHTINFPVQSAKLPSTNPMAIDASGNHFKLLADDTTGESVTWQGTMPENYGSSLVCKVTYTMVSATSGGVAFDLSIMAVSDGDSADVDVDSYDTKNTGTATVPATAGYMDVVSITMTNADSLVAEDFFKLKAARDPTNGSDTATGDAETIGVACTYDES